MTLPGKSLFTVRYAINLFNTFISFQFRVTGLEDLTQCQTIQKQLKRLLYRYLCARAGNTQAIETVPHYEHFMATLQNMEDIGMPQSTLNLSDVL